LPSEISARQHKPVAVPRALGRIGLGLYGDRRVAGRINGGPRPSRGPGTDLGRVTPVAGCIPAVDFAEFLLSVLPVGIYLTVTEAGKWQASWGKRRAGLRIVSTDGGPPGPGQVALRMVVKLLPWPLAYLGVTWWISGVNLSPTLWTVCALAVLLPALSIAMVWRGPQARALHDWLAGTRVVIADPPAARSHRT
jgi:uncharacterized RDD family membrane protein YckC